MKQQVTSTGSQLAWVGMGLAAPAAFLLVVLYALPLLSLLLLSFTDYELGATALRWVGVENHGPDWVFWAEPDVSKSVPLTVRASNRSLAKVAVGDSLWIGWALQDCLIFGANGQRLDINLIPGSTT